LPRAHELGSALESEGSGGFIGWVFCKFRVFQAEAKDKNTLTMKTFPGALQWQTCLSRNHRLRHTMIIIAVEDIYHISYIIYP